MTSRECDDTRRPQARRVFLFLHPLFARPRPAGTDMVCATHGTVWRMRLRTGCHGDERQSQRAAVGGVNHVTREIAPMSLFRLRHLAQRKTLGRTSATSLRPTRRVRTIGARCAGPRRRAKKIQKGSRPTDSATLKRHSHGSLSEAAASERQLKAGDDEISQV